MNIVITDSQFDEIYPEVLLEFKNTLPEAIRASVRILQIAEAIHLKLEVIFKEHKLSFSRFKLLMILRQALSRKLRPSEMASKIQISRSTIAQYLNRLERDQFISRTEGPGDLYW